MQIFERLVEKASNGKYNKQSVRQILTHESTLRRRIPDTAAIATSFLKTYLPKLAEKSEVQFAVDHRHNGVNQREPEKKTLGIAAITNTTNGKKVSILLGYL